MGTSERHRPDAGRRWMLANGLAIPARFMLGALLSAGWVLAILGGEVRADPPRGHAGPVRAVALMADGQIATGGFDATILTWDIAKGHTTSVRRGHIGAVDALLALPNGCLVSGSEDGRIASWCGSAPGRFVEAHAGRISALARSAHADALVTGSFDRTVKLWTLRDDGLPGAERIVTTHAAPVAAVAVRADGAVASGSHDGEVRLTLPDGRTINRSLAVAVTVLAAVGERLIVGLGDGRVQVLGGDLTPRAESELIDGPPTALAITADGRTAIVASARTPVTVVDLVGGAPARPIAGAGGPVWALTLMPGDRQVITTGADGGLRLWNLDGTPPRGVPLTAAHAPAPDRDPHPGARVFRACGACHTIKPGDPARSGPTLAGIMGRRVGTASGFSYSAALKQLDIVWTPETIARLFEVGPATFTPGTTMPEQRITDPEDRRALVEWLARVTR